MDFKKPSSSDSNDTWRKIEIFVNVGNHCLLSIVVFYLIWYCFQDNWSELTCVHSALCTVGFFLMTEGILIMYNQNAPTILTEGRARKTNLHWIFQATGVILMAAGTIVEYYFRQSNGKKHWDAKHAYWGE